MNTNLSNERIYEIVNPIYCASRYREVYYSDLRRIWREQGIHMPLPTKEEFVIAITFWCNHASESSGMEVLNERGEDPGIQFIKHREHIFACLY